MHRKLCISNSQGAKFQISFNDTSQRLEYDAYRCDFEALETGPREAATQAKLQEGRKKFEEHKSKFERLRGDVQIKIKFLDENRVSLFISFWCLGQISSLL